MIKNLFEQALGLGKPWYISSLEFDSGQGKLDIRIDFERGAKFDDNVFYFSHKRSQGGPDLVR
jgi:hypothetical protein